MQLKKEAFSGMVWVFIDYFLVKGVSFVGSIVLARLLMPSDFGIIAMIAIFMTFGNILLDSGLSSSLIRNNNNDDKDYSTVFFTNIFFGILLYVFFFIIAPIIASFFNQLILINIIRFYSIVFLLTSFSSVQMTILIKNMQFKKIAVLNVPSVILGLGVPKYKIIFSGVGKRDDEIAEALEADILFINLESEAEMKRVELIAKELGKKARISIRVNPDIDPKTHPYISTGLNENKFGVDIESAKGMYAYAAKSDNLEPVGIHFHIGSQLTELEPIYEAAKKVSELLRALLTLKINIKFFDVGGGLGVKYYDETTITPYDYAQAILSTLSGTDVTVVCEPGRFMTANGGYFLTKVLYEKQNKEKRFVIVDGAMNDLIRPTLYEAFHGVEVVGKNGNESKADIVGPICESGDFLQKMRIYRLPNTAICWLSNRQAHTVSR
jgi:hypothetical protein